MDTNNTPMPHSQVAAVVKKEPPPIGTLKGETVSLAERLGMNSKKSRVSSKPPLAPPAPTLAAKTIEDNVCIVPATPPSLVKKDTKKADAPQAAQPDASDEDDFLPSRSRIPSSTTTSSKRPVEEVPEEPEPKKRKVAPTPGTAVKTQNLIDEAIQKTKHELEESEKESRRVLSKAVAAETKSLVKVVTFPIHRKSGLQQESRNNDEEERNTNGLVNQKRFKKVRV